MTHRTATATGLPEPAEAERRQAEQASRVLARLAGRDRVRVEAVADDVPPQTFVLPATAVRLLTDVLAHLAQGRVVTVLPDDADLTTQQAADLLNVSRPYLVNLLETQAIPFHKTGTHRRVRLGDLQAYRERKATERRVALAELVQEAEELGMGY